MAVPFVDGLGIFECNHSTKAIQRDISESAALYLIADDCFTFPLIGITAELAVATVLAIAGFDAFCFDAERCPARLRRRRLRFRFCFHRHLPPPTRESR